MMVLVAFAGCSTQSTDTGALRADLDALEQELDKAIEENARLRLKVEDLEIEVEKQKLLIEEVETELAQLPTVSAAPSAAEQSLPPEVEVVTASEVESEVAQEPTEEPMTYTEENSSPMAAPAGEPIESSQPPTEETQIAKSEAKVEEKTVSSQVQVGNTVYITKTGKKYHTNSSCNGATYYECSLEDAIAKGLTPCKKCAGG